MIELEFRVALTERIANRYCGPTDRVIHELGIPRHGARVDIAVVGRQLLGFEIKTSSDTLTRLERQRAAYDRVFDRMYLAVEQRHVARALQETPSWWGVIELAPSPRGKRWLQHRASRLNPQVDLLAVAQLLWRNEVVEELETLGLMNGLRSAPRDRLWRALAEAAPSAISRRELHSRLRRRLSDRGMWRADPQLA